MNMVIYDASKSDHLDDNLVYLVNSTDYPDDFIHSDQKEKLNDFFRNSINGIIYNVQGRLISEVESKINGFEGREVKISVNQGQELMNIRLFLVEKRFYMIQTVTSINKQENPSILRFFNSFKLINH